MGEDGLERVRALFLYSGKDGYTEWYTEGPWIGVNVPERLPHLDWGQRNNIG
jgi:hypothetical protein